MGVGLLLVPTPQLLYKAVNNTFRFVVCKNSICVKEKERVTSGSVDVYTCTFAFSDDWDDLTRTVVFKAGKNEIAIVLSDDSCAVPWEVLQVAGEQLYCGVYGINNDGDIILPTIWALLGKIVQGVDMDADNAQDPTQSVYEQYVSQVAENAQIAAESAKTATEAAEIATSNAAIAVESAESAKASEESAAESESNALKYSELAQEAAEESGYFYVEGREDGHLYYIRSDNLTGDDLTFYDNGYGRLIVQYA